MRSWIQLSFNCIVTCLVDCRSHSDGADYGFGDWWFQMLGKVWQGSRNVGGDMATLCSSSGRLCKGRICGLLAVLFSPFLKQCAQLAGNLLLLYTALQKLLLLCCQTQQLPVKGLAFLGYLLLGVALRERGMGCCQFLPCVLISQTDCLQLSINICSSLS